MGAAYAPPFAAYTAVLHYKRENSTKTTAQVDAPPAQEVEDGEEDAEEGAGAAADKAGASSSKKKKKKKKKKTASAAGEAPAAAPIGTSTAERCGAICSSRLLDYLLYHMKC